MTENHEFDRIYEKYKKSVLNTANNQLHDYSYAADIMQETFLALYQDLQKKGSLAAYRNIGGWLCAVAKHNAINYQKKLTKEIPSNELETKEGASAFVRESTEAEYMEDVLNIERTHLHEKICTGLLEKNERWYKAMMLTYYVEMPQIEVAELMEMTPDAFYVMLHRAKNWIGKTYGVEYDELNRQ